ncbi:hypothetical protein [Streptomyces dysideae]|uniref:Uncharacterized protein n=1 Tax=Streptomyces dysideae TaxID=909626 RepID=A0A101UUK6_9ACTN|nr:hypothetical protein [Streptomyces dysideae]KUO17140.1 hypothetical protein AQJ91_31720 [Streptomyces dysideae]
MSGAAPRSAQPSLNTPLDGISEALRPDTGLMMVESPAISRTPSRIRAGDWCACRAGRHRSAPAPPLTGTTPDRHHP